MRRRLSQPDRNRLAGWLPPRTVRLRLSALYGSLFLGSGAALLAVTYALVQARPAVQLASLATPLQLARARAAAQRILGGEHAVADLQALAAAQRTDTLHQLFLACGIALGIMTLVSAWLGWLVAGRTLQPLRVMTARAQRISGQNLHERLALRGPSDELKELADTFDGLLTRLEAVFSAQRQFVANASHELRTPLTLQRAMVEVALADPDAAAEALRATCERVLVAGAQQEHIIDALLTLAHGQRGLDRREPFDLATVTRNVLNDRDPGARQQEHGLRVTASLRPAPTSGDSRLAERLIANLVENALVHNVDGGWLTVHTGADAECAFLLIANSGPVIDPGEVSRLLRPFQRLGNDRTGQRAGLGLAIVAAIAEAHAAALAVRPSAGGGLEVEVRFPVQPAGPRRPVSPGAGGTSPRSWKSRSSPSSA